MELLSHQMHVLAEIEGMLDYCWRLRTNFFVCSQDLTVDQATQFHSITIILNIITYGSFKSNYLKKSI